MISNNQDIQLYIEGELADLFLEGTSIRINNTLIDPTKLTASTTTYSYSFDLPLTKNNCRIFDNINIPSKKNKFDKRYKAELYAAESLIFSGSLKVAEVGKGEISCNLYIPKINTLENLFGETTMNELSWFVDFDGTITMNEVNNDMSTKYFFPYVAYSLPNKKPYSKSGSGYEKYSEKKFIDRYSYFYFNSFVPSMNLSELLKRCFKHKGITLVGNAVTDDVFKEIYLSNYIADGQDPLYNLGNPNIGDIKFNLKYSNFYQSGGTYTKVYDHITEWQYDDEMKPQPSATRSKYFGISNYSDKSYVYNWDETMAHNMMNEDALAQYVGMPFKSYDGETMTSPITVTYNSNAARMLVNGGVQIPSNGWYEISIKGKMGIPSFEGDATSANNSFKGVGVEYIPSESTGGGGGGGRRSTSTESRYEEKETAFSSSTLSFSTYDFPIEFQMLRYRPKTDSDIESMSHNLLWGGIYPNEQKGILEDGVTKFYKNNTGITNNNIANTSLMDSFNNPNYVCGFMSSGEGATLGYIKDGKSYNEETTFENEALYNCQGYYEYSRTGTTAGRGQTVTLTTELSDTYKNQLEGYYDYSKIELSSDKRSVSAETKMIIKLDRNDILLPFINTRALPLYSASGDLEFVTYCVSADLDIEVRAVAPSGVSRTELSYNMESRFDKQLNLGNFLNKDQKMSDFISSIQKTFNLSYQQNNDIVTMNINRMNDKIGEPIDLDNRCHASEATFASIDFPSKIENKFTIDTDEEGFYRSVSDEHINDNDWKDFGEYGSKSIIVSSVDDATELTQTVPFSYCWYNEFQIEDFYWNTMGHAGHSYYYVHNIQVPIIGKSEWWIEGYKYAEMAAKDGRGLKQRFWFRDEPLNNSTVPTAFYRMPVNGTWRSKNVDWYNVTLPTNFKKINEKETVFLSYYNGGNTLLGKFFNVDFDSASDSVEIEAYITPMEYERLSKGASVKFDDNIYKVLKIQGFDPNGYNKTKLTLIALK